MSKLHVVTIQSNLIWEDVNANLNQFETKLALVDRKADLVVLPEMFTTGFSMNTALAEFSGDTTMTWMEKMASHHGFSICGSVMIKNANNEVFNRLIWMNPDGSYHTYDKRHLFSIGSEDNYFVPGQQKKIINFKGFNIQLLICYDLRFPVWIRRTKQEDYEAIVLVANWPEKRAAHWKALLRARAIENQCFVVAVNRVGFDGKQIAHSGDSCVIEPTGTVAYEKSFDEEVKMHLLDKELVNNYRKEFPVINDADAFGLL